MRNGNGATSVVTAGEISRNFGQWQDRALTGPVIVTHHGRPRVVLLSADYYSSHKGQAGGSSGAHTSFETSQAAILDHLSEAFMALDAELHITAVNPELEALVGQNASQVIGRSWDEVLPQGARSLMGEQLRRALRTGETLDFEAPGSEPHGRRHAVRVFPHPGGVAVLIQNHAAERELRFQLHEAKALDDALGALQQVMILRLDVRGLITSVDEAFSRVVGFSSDDLTSCRLSDIIRPSDRPVLTSAFEAVLQGRPPTPIDTCLLTRDGGETPVSIGVGAVKDHLAPGGLIAALTLVREAAPRAAAKG